jgi:putative ABC transport system substrate-binding protein
MKRREFIAGLGSASILPSWSAYAQQALPVVGFLALGNSFPTSPAFRRGLAEAGFFPDKNVRFEFRASPSNQRLAEAAIDLVKLRPAVIVATNSPITVVAARAASATIPVVFATIVDPVAYGFVASLNRPGGATTGISLLSTELIGKQLNLLLEVAPQAKKVAYLSGPRGAPIFEDLRSRTVAAGQALRREVIVLQIGSARDLEPAFVTLVDQGAGALIVGAFTSFFPLRDTIAALAQNHKIPAIYPSRFFLRGGGLMSYAADVEETDRLLGYQFVGRILKGTSPADLPVQQPTKFKLVLNLAAAKASGIDIPATLLTIADEVIE